MEKFYFGGDRLILIGRSLFYILLLNIAHIHDFLLLLDKHNIVYFQINNNNNNNNIYLKSNIHKSSIDYKYIHMYNKIMLYT